MTDHVLHPMPEDYKQTHPTLCTHACIYCGVWADPGRPPPHPTCEAFMAKTIGYMEGKMHDPFASVRSTLKKFSLTPVEIINEALKKIGPQPETRPGLSPETIDRDAYDDFMRGL